MRRPPHPGVGVVFLGTADFAVPSLRSLVAAGERVAAVVTQPDRPRGRGQRPQPSPVKDAARELSLPVLQPGDVNAPDAVAELGRLEPEFLVVVAYGQLLRPPLLGVPRRGAVNLHASLLPRHRGPSPVAWAILEGDRETGNTTMLVEPGLDSGPVLKSESVPLAPEDTRGDLEARLSARGAELLLETLRGLRAGTLAPTPQDPAVATWSRLLSREMRLVDWSEPADAVRRKIHALSPAPGALATLRGRLLKVLRVAEVPCDGPPGAVVAVGGAGPTVACGRGGVTLVEIQPEGKRAMSGADLARGGGIAVGDQLGTPLP